MKKLFPVFYLLSLNAEHLNFEDRKFYFHHIPKTAGISSLVYISEALAKQVHFIDLNPKNTGYHFPYKANDAHTINVYDENFLSEKTDQILWSHCPYYYLDKYKDHTFMFTLLRNPLDRALSHRRFFKIQVHVKRDEILHAETEVLQSSTTPNLQTLYMTALDPFNPLISTRAHLESAKHTLEYKMDHFGFTENLKVSLDEMLGMFDVKSPKPLQSINVSKDRAYLDEEYDKEEIRKENWADFELYEFAKNLYKKRKPI